jgi:hypothetical protein
MSSWSLQELLVCVHVRVCVVPMWTSLFYRASHTFDFSQGRWLSGWSLQELFVCACACVCCAHVDKSIFIVQVTHLTFHRGGG